MAEATTKQVTFRLPLDLYETVRHIAVRQKTSLNRLVQEGLRVVVAEEQAREMKAAYEALGRDLATENEVEGYFVAQREVVLRDEA